MFMMLPSLLENVKDWWLLENDWPTIDTMNFYMKYSCNANKTLNSQDNYPKVLYNFQSFSFVITSLKSNFFSSFRQQQP